MHIHGNQINMSAMNPYSAAAEKAIAAQRSAKTRKKLLEKAWTVEAELTPEANTLVEHWSETQQSVGQNPYAAPVSPK
jgi:hypothetical protein